MTWTDLKDPPGDVIPASSRYYTKGVQLTGTRLKAAIADGVTDRKPVTVTGTVNISDLVSGGVMTPIEIDVQQTALIGRKAILDASGVAVSGLAMHVTGFDTSTNYGQIDGGVEGVTLAGPGVGVVGLQALKVDGAGTHANGAKASFRKFQAHDFDKIFVLGNNAYGIDFDRFEFWNANTIVEIPFGLSNAGELINFRSGFLFNSTLGVSVRNSGVDANFIGCSADYCKRLLETTSGQLSWIGGHVEAGSSSGIGTADADYFLYCGQNSSTLKFMPAEFLVASSRAAFPIGYSQGVEAAAVGGGFGHTGGAVQIGGLHFQPDRCDVGRSGRTYQPSVLIEGGGRVSTGPYGVYAGGLDIPVSKTRSTLPPETTDPRSAGDFQSVSLGRRGLSVQSDDLSAPFISTTDIGPFGAANALKFRTAAPKYTLALSASPVGGFGSATVGLPGIGSTSIAAAAWNAAGVQAAIRAVDPGLATATVTQASQTYTIQLNGAALTLTGPITYTPDGSPLRTGGGTNITGVVTVVFRTVAEGANSYADHRVPMRGGERLQLDYWLKLTGVTAAAVSWNVRLEFFNTAPDGTGTSLGSVLGFFDYAPFTADTVNASFNDYVHVQLPQSVPAPAGTSYAVLHLRASNIAGTTPWPDGPAALIKFGVPNVAQ